MRLSALSAPAIADAAVSAEHIPVDAAQPDRLRAQPAEHMDERFVHLARQHHAHDFRRLLVRIAQSVDETGSDPHARKRLGDLRPAAVDEHHLDPDELKEREIAHDRLFEFVALHRVPAVFDDEDLILIFLDVRHRFQEKFRLFFSSDHQVL